MAGAYLFGFRGALRRSGLIVGLFGVNAVSGLALSAAAWIWLSSALDASVATRSLLTDLDLNVFVDLWVHHRLSFQMLLVAAAVMTIAFYLFWVWLNAVTVLAVGEGLPLSECARRGAGLYPPYLALGVVVTATNLLSLGALFFAVRALVRWTADSADEMLHYWIWGSGLGCGGVLLLFQTAVHDHARIHCAATGATAGQSYGWALGFVLRDWRPAVLAALLAVTGAAGWLTYQAVGMLWAVNWMPGVVMSLLWGQALVLFRSLLRVWTFAAETDLQNSREVADF